MHIDREVPGIQYADGTPIALITAKGRVNVNKVLHTNLPNIGNL